MDHVTTQLPFALSVAGVSTALAGIVGMLTL
jgi:Na+/H+ antiporter NhaC